MRRVPVFNLPILLAVSAGAFSAVGGLRGGIQIIVVYADFELALRILAATLGFSLFWVPVSLVLGVGWSWSSRRTQFAATLVLVLAAALLLEPAWMGAVVRASGGRSIPFWPRVVLRLDTNLLFVVAILGTLWAVASHQRQVASQVDAARLETAAADTRLYLLTMQLQPHFLFNTLNLVSQLAYEDSGGAQQTLGHLRDLMEQSLAFASQGVVAVREECRFVAAYLDIQQRRFRERLQFGINVADEVLDAAVPALLLQPIVENAIRHGLADRPEGGRVDIDARSVGRNLVLRIEDNGLGIDLSSSVEHMGLRNTRFRLDQFAPGENQMTIEPGGTNGTVVTVVVPLRQAHRSEPTSDLPEPMPTLGSQPDAGRTGDAGDTVRRERPKRRIPGYLLLIVAWGAVAILWTELQAAAESAAGGLAAWGGLFRASAINAGLWLGLTPVAVRLARHYDVTRGLNGRNITIHVAAATGIATVHILTWLFLLHRFVPDQYAQVQASATGWGVWDGVLYLAITAFTTVSVVGIRFRETLFAVAAAEARLAHARLAALHLRVHPTVLLRGIDAVTASARQDPNRCEHAVTRMGDMLRMLLTNADRDQAPLYEETALLEAYRDVVEGTDSGCDLSAPPAMRDATVPAVLLPAVAAAVGGRIGSLRAFAGALGALQLELRFDHDHADDSPGDPGSLEAVRERLRALFGIAHDCRIDEGPLGISRVSLELPLRRWRPSQEEVRGMAPGPTVA